MICKSLFNYEQHTKLLKGNSLHILTLNFLPNDICSILGCFEKYISLAMDSRLHRVTRDQTVDQVQEIYMVQL